MSAYSIFATSYKYSQKLWQPIDLPSCGNHKGLELGAALLNDWLWTGPANEGELGLNIRYMALLPLCYLT